MSKRLLSEEDVKALFNAPDFRSISKSQIVEFVSSIPAMDKDVAVKVIEQFPNFSITAKEMITQLNSVADTLIKENSKSVQDTIDGYKTTLNALEMLIAKEEITTEDKKHFAEKMIEVADKIAVFDANNKQFLKWMHKSSTYIVCGTLLLCTMILGVNMKGIMSPLHK